MFSSIRSKEWLTRKDQFLYAMALLVQLKLLLNALSKTQAQHAVKMISLNTVKTIHVLFQRAVDKIQIVRGPSIVIKVKGSVLPVQVIQIAH